MASTNDPRKSAESAVRLSVDGLIEPRKSTDSATRNAVSAQTSAFQSALGAWRNIDLSSLQKSLDSTASEIVNNQRDSLVERKELAQKTKEYRKLDEEAKKDEWKGLLKSYQAFIDNLTTSKKGTETAFLSMYSTLSEAPDPYPLLEATIESLVNYSEIQAMEKDNASLNTTINRLSIQVSRLESSLASKNKELEKKEREKDEEAKRVEEVWRGVVDEKTRNWEANEKALKDKLEHQETVLKEIKAHYEVAQRLGGPKSPSGEDDVLVKERTAELEIMGRDLERTTMRVAEMEARNEQLRMELEKASSEENGIGKAEDRERLLEDDPVFIRLQEENTKLLKKVEAARAGAEELKRERERKTRTLERTIEGLQQDREGLKEKVSRWSDYDDVRRELEILKSIEFSTGDDDEEEDSDLDFTRTGTADNSKGKDDKESLEQLLLARNKKLGNELTILRVSHQDLTERLQALQTSLDSTTAELSKSESLNQKLEDDLLSLQQESAPQHSSALSVAGTYVSRYPRSSIAAGRVSPTSSIISGVLPKSTSQGSFDAFRGEASPVGAGSSILPMITQQRDRFRGRNQQLETELQNAQTTIGGLRQEASALRKDNLQLYEKIKYISSYTRPTAGSSSMASGSSQNNGGLSIDRYRQAYETQISPFETFRGRESARAYKRMGLAERMLYSVTRVILANRTSRNLFALYCVLLHLLVFCMLYWTGTVQVEKHLPGMAAAHLSEAGGGAVGVGSEGVGEGAQPDDWHQQISFDDRM